MDRAFLENEDNLINEVDGIIANLQKYSKALKEHDAVTLKALLKEVASAKKDRRYV